MSLQEHLYMNLVQDKRYLYFLEGLKNTLIITFCALVVGVTLGFIIGMVRSIYDRTGKGKIANGICQFYLTIMRGTPAVIQLMIFYYCIFTSRIFSGVFVGIIAFGLNSAAYVAEIIRSGIMSIPKGQMEAGRSLGFSYGETMRYIIMPQAVRNVLPAIFNEFIVLIKETAVAGYVAVQDLTKAGDIVRSRTYDSWTPLLTVALIYLILTMFFSFLEKKMEEAFQRKERG